MCVQYDQVDKEEKIDKFNKVDKIDKIVTFPDQSFDVRTAHNTSRVFLTFIKKKLDSKTCLRLTVTVSLPLDISFTFLMNLIISKNTS